MTYSLRPVGTALSKLSDKLKQKLTNKEYRDIYMDEQIRSWIARQIRVLREQRGWSQKELAERAGKPQSVISRLEDPDYGKVSLQTLLEMRSAFDVGLCVRFVDFGSAISASRELSTGAIEVPSFDLSQLSQREQTFNDAHYTPIRCEPEQNYTVFSSERLAFIMDSHGTEQLESQQRTDIGETLPATSGYWIN